MYDPDRLRGHSWFVGNMDRDEANSRLAPYPSNTFLVRGRMVNGEQVGHALSLKTDIDVKHMKIESTPAESGQVVTGSIGQTCFQRGNGQFNYFLSDARHFKSIVDLITFYCRNSLKECFSGLNTPLQFSVGEVTIVQVLHDYTPEDEHINRLPLKKGDQVSSGSYILTMGPWPNKRSGVNQSLFGFGHPWIPADGQLDCVDIEIRLGDYLRLWKDDNLVF